jgi:thymidylate synthase
LFQNATLVCDSLADAIPKVLQLVTERGEAVYVRGELNREVLAVDVVINDPTDRIPMVAGRRPITAFCTAEFLWYAAQRTSLAPLELYAPSIRSYYGGMASVTGSDYGGQMFGGREGGSQWDKVAEVLRADPGSKRAFIGIFDPDKATTLLPANGDVSCTIGFQALVREGRLNWVTTMRANDAYRGFVSDTFSFTMFQELLARTLNLPVGQYLHRVTSIHSFPEDEVAISRILAGKSAAPTARASYERMPAIAPESFWAHLQDFWEIHDRGAERRDWSVLDRVGEFDDEWWGWAASILRSFHDRGATS